MSAYNNDDLNRLEPNYLNNYGLREAPFATTHHDKFLYVDAERAQCLNMLQHMTHYSNLLLIVQGEQGVGKTALLQRFMKNAEPDWQLCQIAANTMTDSDQLLFQAAQGFGVSQLPQDSSQLQEMLYARVATLHHSDKVPILLIDEAHLLPKDALLAIFNLADSYVNDVNLLRIILFCEPEIDKIINTKEVKSLSERVTHTMHVPPLSEESTAEYLKHRLAVAGFNGGSPFSPRVIKKIYKSSHGIPAKINDLAHQILDQGDFAQAQTQTPDEAVVTTPTPEKTPATVSSQNNKPMLWAAVAVLAVAVVFTFQDSINGLFEEEKHPKVIELMMGDEETGLTTVDETASTDSASAEQKVIALDPSEPEAAPSPPAPIVSEKDSVTPQQENTTTTASTAENQPSIPETPTTPAIALHQVSPNPVPTSRQRQTITINGEGFTPKSKVTVSWTGKTKQLAAHQVSIKSDTEVAINVTVGSNEDNWTIQVSDPVNGQSNTLGFNVKLVDLDKDYRRDKWALAQNPGRFTLQLLGTGTKAGAKQFIDQHKIKDKAGYIQTIRNNKPWYSVIYGDYENQASAKQAAKTLPASLNKAKPWVRRLDEIQTRINTARKIATKPKVVNKPTPTTSSAKTDNSEAWLWSQDPSYFTLQLLGARQSNSIQKFLRKYTHLNGKAVYFHTKHEARDWYTVIYGVYPDRQQAKDAIKRLPAELRSASPWVRSFGSIHAELDRTD